MFTDTTIKFVIDCIGWDTPEASTGIVVSNDNLTSTSGRIFKALHSLVTVENVNEICVPVGTSNDRLNEILYEFKEQGAYEAINKIFDDSIGYDPETDYYTTVVKFKGVIQEVMGLSVCAMVLQSMINSKRVNSDERKAKYGMLKVELEGFRDMNGIQISKGLLAQLNYAIYIAKKTIFPEKVEIHNYDW